jgi:MFS family permease
LDDDNLYDDGEKNKFYEKGFKEDGAELKGPNDCDGKVYGLKPSSMVSVLGSIGGLVAAFTMPLAGSIVDATDKRHLFGGVCSAVFVVSNFAMVFITRDSWFYMMLLQAIVATFAFYGQVLVVYAYLPELFDNEADCVSVTTNGRLYEQGGMLTLIVITTVVSLGLGLDVVATAVTGQVGASPLLISCSFSMHDNVCCCRLMFGLTQVVAVLLGGPTCYYAFTLYKPRKANRQLPDGKWLIVDGFSNLVRRHFFSVPGCFCSLQSCFMSIQNPVGCFPKVEERVPRGCEIPRRTSKNPPRRPPFTPPPLFFFMFPVLFESFACSPPSLIFFQFSVFSTLGCLSHRVVFL